jgi:hypothetical protein
VVEYALLRLNTVQKDAENTVELVPVWIFVGIAKGRTKREAWEDAEATWGGGPTLPGDGQNADFRLVPLSAWGEEFSVTGKAKVEREVKGL